VEVKKGGLAQVGSPGPNRVNTIVPPMGGTVVPPMTVAVSVTMPGKVAGGADAVVVMTGTTGATTTASPGSPHAVEMGALLASPL